MTDTDTPDVPPAPAPEDVQPQPQPSSEAPGEALDPNVADEGAFLRALGIDPGRVISGTIRVEFHGGKPYVRMETLLPVSPTGIGLAFLASAPTSPMQQPAPAEPPAPAAPQDHLPPGPRRTSRRPAKKTTTKATAKKTTPAPAKKAPAKKAPAKP